MNLYTLYAHQKLMQLQQRQLDQQSRMLWQYSGMRKGKVSERNKHQKPPARTSQEQLCCA